MRDGQTNEQLKTELLSQWKLEAEFRNFLYVWERRFVVYLCHLTIINAWCYIPPVLHVLEKDLTNKLAAF